MKTYIVFLTDGTTIIVESKAVRTKQDNGIIFYSDRDSLVENRLYGPIIHASFQPNQYKYFIEEKVGGTSCN